MSPRPCYPLLVALAVGAACPAGVQDSPTTADSPTTSGPSPTTGEPTTTDTTEASSTGQGTTDELTSSTSFASTTGPIEPMCGDGIVTEPEECDDGELNADTAACTLACKHAVCGDGLVWAAGGEECDFAQGNNEAYGGCDPVSCHRGPHCGDGQLDPKHEVCDKGPLNGSGVSDDEFAPCDSKCDFFGRTLFVTSAAYDGDLGGVSGGDLKCQAAAAAAGLPHANQYRAWLSDDFQSPAGRLKQWNSAVPLILVGGLVVASDIPELVLDGPRIGVSRTEFGTSLFEESMWTNTSSYGEIFSVIDHCDGWTSSGPQLSARIGLNALAVEDGPAWQIWRAERLWTSYGVRKCNEIAHLYCVDDSELVEGEG